MNITYLNASEVGGAYIIFGRLKDGLYFMGIYEGIPLSYEHADLFDTCPYSYSDENGVFFATDLCGDDFTEFYNQHHVDLEGPSIPYLCRCLYSGLGAQDEFSNYMKRDFVRFACIKIKDMTYELDEAEKSATVFSCANHRGSFVVNIPDYIMVDGERYAVTSIDRSAFWDCKNLTAVFIPDSLAEISSEPFEKCKLLTELIIPGTEKAFPLWVQLMEGEYAGIVKVVKPV